MGSLQTGSRKSTRATFTNGKLRLTHRLHLPPSLLGFKDETRPQLWRTSVLPVLDEIPDTPYARLGNIGTHSVALGSRGKGFLRRQIMSFKFGPHPPFLTYLPYGRSKTQQGSHPHRSKPQTLFSLDSRSQRALAESHEIHH